LNTHLSALSYLLLNVPVFVIDARIITAGRRLGGVTMVHTSKFDRDLDGLS